MHLWSFRFLHGSYSWSLEINELWSRLHFLAILFPLIGKKPLGSVNEIGELKHLFQRKNIKAFVNIMDRRDEIC